MGRGRDVVLRPRQLRLQEQISHRRTGPLRRQLQVPPRKPLGILLGCLNRLAPHRRSIHAVGTLMAERTEDTRIIRQRRQPGRHRPLRRLTALQHGLDRQSPYRRTARRHHQHQRQARQHRPHLGTHPQLQRSPRLRIPQQPPARYGRGILETHKQHAHRRHLSRHPRRQSPDRQPR